MGQGDGRHSVHCHVFSGPVDADRTGIRAQFRCQDVCAGGSALVETAYDTAVLAAQRIHELAGAVNRVDDPQGRPVSGQRLVVFLGDEPGVGEDLEDRLHDQLLSRKIRLGEQCLVSLYRNIQGRKSFAVTSQQGQQPIIQGGPQRFEIHIVPFAAGCRCCQTQATAVRLQAAAVARLIKFGDQWSSLSDVRT